MYKKKKELIKNFQLKCITNPRLHLRVHALLKLHLLGEIPII
jgi:hypothetical protein